MSTTMRNDNLNTLENDLESCIESSKITSRKIGEAKRAGEDTTDLLSEMRSLSSRRQELERAIRELQPADIETSSEQASADSEPVRHEHSRTPQEDFKIHVLGEDASAWNRYALDNEHARVHHLAEWRDIIARSYGLHTIYLYAQKASGDVVGILPLIHQKSRLFGNSLISMPYFHCAGAVADSVDIEHALLDEAKQHGVRLGVDHIEIREDCMRDGLATHDHKVNMELDIPGSSSALWDRLPSKVRSQIRRAQEHMTDFVIGGEELLDDFYRIYTTNMRDLGSPSHGDDMIRDILRTIDGSRIVVLYRQGRAVSAGLILKHRERMEIPLASTLRSENRNNMNMLFYWHTLEHAAQSGCERFDFGRSSKGTGTYRFKAQWGARPRQLYWHYIVDGNGEPPTMNKDNPKLAFVINIWKRLPVFLTRRLGPWIVRHLP